jgi:hypothetical protein
LPTNTANSALPLAMPAATGTSERACGTDATAPNAKTRNSGPGGCQSWTAAITEPSTATTAAIPTATHARDARFPTSTPATTETVSSAPALACMTARDRWMWLRPYSDAKAPNAA